MGVDLAAGERVGAGKLVSGSRFQVQGLTVSSFRLQVTFLVFRRKLISRRRLTFILLTRAVSDDPF